MISNEALMLFLDGEADSEVVRAVEAALAVDPDLRARLDGLRRTDLNLKAGFDALLDRPNPDRLIDAVRAGVAAAGPRLAVETVRPIRTVAPARRGRGYGQAILRSWRAAPRWVGLAAAGQVGLLVVAIAVFRPSNDTASYHALGSAPEAHAQNLMVMFRPETAERTLRASLASAGATIVGGPTAGGVYILHVTPARRVAALAALRRRPEIIMAEQIDSGATP
jgi:GNAT superfamily N-acetyltransferase